MLTTAVIAVILAALAAVGILWFRWRLSSHRRRGFEELARKRGWRLGWDGDDSDITLAPAEGAAEPWSYRLGAAGPGGRGRESLWQSPAPALPRATLVIGPPLPPEAAARAGALIGAVPPALARLLGPMPTGAADLAPVAGGANRAFTLLATEPAAAAALDEAAFGEALASWQARARMAGSHPVLVLGPEGLSVRLQGGAETPVQCAAFIDWCTALSRRLLG